MAERPSFQFYPADWRGNAKLQRCSMEARGAWIDVMCLLHDADEYGVLRWPLADIAQAVRLPVDLLHELIRKGVLKGGESKVEDYVYRPYHAGKHGDPITLTEGRQGPCWYCSRFVRDEWKRNQRGKATRFTTANQPPKDTPSGTPPGRVGERQGDGSSSASASASSSASSVSQKLPVTDVTGADGSQGESKPDPIWGPGLAFLKRKGVPEKQARPFLGKLKQQAGDIHAAALLADAEAQDITDPIPWLSAGAVKAAAKKNKPAANDDFRGKSYASTPDDQLPASLR